MTLLRTFAVTFALLSSALTIAPAAFAAAVPPAAGSETDKLPALVFYVAPTGNDAWSGMLAEPNAARSDGPFNTLERARDAVRQNRKAGKISDGAAVLIRGGDYELSKSFELTADDSGTAAAPITYRAFPGEKPVLFGGKRITGFKPFKDKILQADVAAQDFKGERFWQLYLNGQRQIPSRYPNFDPTHPRTGGWAFVAAGRAMRVLTMRSEDVRTWAHPEDGEVDVYPTLNYFSCIIPIASVDREKRTITLTRDTWGEMRPLNRYFVRGLFEELDAPGEWYLNPRTSTLYFWPPDDAGDLTKAVIRAPLTENVIVLDHTEYVTLRGLAVECCERSGVLVREAKSCLVAGCTIRNLGAHSDGSAGIEIRDGASDSAVGNDIFQVGSYGVVVAGGDEKTLAPAGHVVDNNYIHHTGVTNGHGFGVMVTGVGQRVSHNLMHDTARGGIYSSGNDHVFEYNRIRDVNLDTQDTGGIYLCAPGDVSWMNRGTIIRYNFLTDMGGLGIDQGRWQFPYFSWGIVLDDAVCETTVFGNIVARAYFGGATIHGGLDNVIENNIFVEGTRQQMTWQGPKPPNTTEPDMRKHYAEFKDNEAYRKHYPKFATLNPETDGTMGGNRFVHNIVSYRNRALLFMTGNYQSNRNESDYNLEWHFGQALEVWPGPVPKVPGLSSWQWWQKQEGNDTHSGVGEPLFVDPEKDDYRLKPESPAFKLGFQPIPVEKIGPYGSPLRASWPIVEAPGARERPFASESPVPIPRP